MEDRGSLIIAVSLVASFTFFRWLAFSLNYGVYQFGIFNWLIPIAQMEQNLGEVLLIIGLSNDISLVLGIGSLIFFWRYFKRIRREREWHAFEQVFDIIQTEGQV